MSVIIDNRTFYDEFTGSGGGGINYFNANIGNRIRCEIEFHTYLAEENKRLTFDSATKTITNANRIDTTNFLTDGWIVGMTITVSDTASNDGDYTITKVEARVITVAEALVNETDEDCSFYDVTPITALDYYYNLVQNSSQDSYISLTDKFSLQKYITSGLDASVVTPVNCYVGTSSWGWVTNELIDSLGQTDEVFIEGVSITDYKQYFKLTQYFTAAPLWTAEQFNNFNLNQPPGYLFPPTSLKHIFKIDCKFEDCNPIIPHTTDGITNRENGISSWLNANSSGSRSDYSITSVTYFDSDANEIDSIEITDTTSVEIVINSASGAFVYSAPSAPSTSLQLDFIFCDLLQTNYTDTQTTLRQNLLNDRCFFEIADAIQNGEYYGTAYQIFKNIEVTYNSANQITLYFDVEMASQVIAKLTDLASTNRNFAIVVTTQDYLITTTQQCDRIALLADFNNCTYNQDDSTLIEAVDDIHVFTFPNDGINAENVVEGWEGDPIYTDFPFLIESTAIDGVTPTLMTAGMQIVAVKSGEDDFVIDSKVFSVGLVRKFNGVQTIDESETLGFNALEGSSWNIASIIRDDTLDVGRQVGFRIKYAFVLRYDYWLEVIRTSEQFQYPIYKDIEDITQSWISMIDGGWELKLKFVATAKGYDDWITSFWAYTSIVIKAIGAAPDSGPTFTTTIEFYDKDGKMVGETDPADPTLFGCVLIGEKTRIKAIYTGNFSVMPTDYNSFYAYIFADLLDNGGVYNRRTASTEFNSESDSPFSYVTEDVGATTSWHSNNLTINIFGTSSITVECWYDDTIQNWAINNEGIQLYHKLGFLKITS